MKKKQEHKTEKIETKKPWYKKPWGIVIAVIFFPFFLLWFLWAKSKQSNLVKILGTIGCVFLIFIYLGILVGPQKGEFKEVKEKQTISFSETKKDDNTLKKGETKVEKEGVIGEKVITYRVKYVNGVEKSKEKVSEEIIKNPENKIILVGTYEPPPTPPATAPAPAPTPAPSSSSGSVYYANCTAARNAGAAPIYAGQPGYRSALDRDGDGVACE